MNGVRIHAQVQDARDDDALAMHRVVDSERHLGQHQATMRLLVYRRRLGERFELAEAAVHRFVEFIAVGNIAFDKVSLRRSQEDDFAIHQDLPSRRFTSSQVTTSSGFSRYSW